MKTLFAVSLISAAVWLLSDLRHSFEARRSRWGRKGAGPKMSAFSIILTAAWLLGLGGVILAPYVTAHVPPDLEVVVAFAGLVAVGICGLLDWGFDDRRKKNA